MWTALRSRRAPHVPAPSVVLRALTRCYPRILTKNAIVRVPTTVVWARARTAGRTSGLAERFGVLVAPGAGGFVSRATLKSSLDGEIGWSDYYFSEGTAAVGSGRSVFYGGYQLRGVGRTSQASSDGPLDEIDGRVDPRHAVQELAKALVFERILGNRALGPDFALLVPRGTLGSELDSFILGRRGSPLRVAHLRFLAAASVSAPTALRLARGRRFLNELDGRAGIDVSATRIERLFDGIVSRALAAVVEARFLCVRFTNWADNGDVFARPFDFEDALFLAPVAAIGIADLPAPTRGHSPLEYLSTTVRIRATDEAPYLPSLQALVNALEACDLLATEIGYDAVALRQRYAWRSLEDGYVAALVDLLAKELDGGAARKAPLQEAARVLADELPLVPTVRAASFRWDGVVANLLGGASRTKAEARVAKALVRAAGGPIEAAKLGQRWKKLFDALETRRVTAMIEEAIRQTARVAKTPSLPARERGYASVFAGLEAFARSIPRRV